ncbi:MAG: ABC-2 type transport system ATP-binding protein [Planctomycetota bacterium]|jgi:ABC-2 type transport system ATP-binding protein
MSLQLIDVDHSYGTRPALSGVNLEIRAGDCYGFIGHNGAGKTTAMRIALGLIRPQTGRVIVDGYEASKNPLEVRARMGGLIERPGFFDYWSGPKNLRLLAKLQGVNAKEVKSECDELMDMVGLGHVMDLAVGGYSQGMRQRLGIAQAMLGKPRYLLLDEPGNGLDPEGLADMRRLLLRLTKDEGMTVLLSSHQLHEVSEICNRIAVLKKGEVILEDDAQKILFSGRPLYEFATADEAAAKTVLKQLDLSVLEENNRRLVVDVGDITPATVTKSLIEGGVGLESFARKAPSLEEIYLELQRPKEAPADHPERKEESPAARLAPGGELFRAMRYEWQRLTSRKSFFVALSLPFLVAFWDVRSRFILAEDAAAKVASEGLMSTTDVTAYEGIAWGLRTSLLFASLVFCGIASQSLAAELDRGTLRNALLRPVRRWTLALGKILTLLLCAVGIYALLMWFVALVSGYYFDYEALVEILPNNEVYSLVKLEDLEQALSTALKSGLVPMLTYSLIGFAAGSLARNSTTALTFAIGGVFGLDLLRSILPDRADERWLPAAHLPSKLGDTSFLLHYEDTVTGVSNVTESISQWPLAPWCFVAVLVALFALSKRDVR